MIARLIAWLARTSLVQKLLGKAGGGMADS